MPPMKFVPGTPLGSFARMSFASGRSFEGHASSSGHAMHWHTHAEDGTRVSLQDNAWESAI